MIDYSLVAFFTHHIIQAAPLDDTIQGSLVHSPNPTTSTEYFKFGITDGLPPLLYRIYSLQHNSRTKSFLKSDTISESLAIWHDLERWNPTTSSTDYHTIYASYSSAMFIWLYSIIHPDNIHDDKIQTMVQMGLADMVAVCAAELVPFLLIPLFIHGLASIRPEDRDTTGKMFGRVQMLANDSEWQIYWQIVEKSWRMQDAGMKDSWDWIGLVAGV